MVKVEGSKIFLSEKLKNELPKLILEQVKKRNDEGRDDDGAGKNTGIIRMSQLGKPCLRQLWFETHRSADLEPLRPNVYLKFLFGHVLEGVLLDLAREAGATVEGEQDELEFAGVKGHRDAVIDGTIVDVKTASPYSFERFKKGLKPEEDSFGYLTQLRLYLAASQDDPLVTNKTGAAFLAINKVSGDVCIDYHEFDMSPAALKELEQEILSRIEAIKDGTTVPPRSFKDVAEGAKGNKRLGVNCSYCAAKWLCWPNLRGFAYSNGPKYLTTVKSLPKVPEITKD